jgi:triosephosphate isomerase
MPYMMPHSHGEGPAFVVPLSAQNFYPASNGAFTGEISLEMLQQIGVKYSIIGHSERREYFGETNEFVNAKVKYALSLGVIPVMAFGETLQQFEAEETLDVLRKQLKEGLVDLSSEDMAKVVLAYEPI